MADDSPVDAEILVHITAPSRAVDDVAYRQLAQAYIDFKPQRRVEIPLHGDQSTQSSDPEAKAPSGRHIPPSFQPAAFDINSQNMSFADAMDNRSSPGLRYATHNQSIVPSSQRSIAGSQSSWIPPPSQISDSYPMPNAALFNTSLTRVLQNYIGKRTAPFKSSESKAASQERLSLSCTTQEQFDVPSSLPIAEESQRSQVELHRREETAEDIVPVTPQVAKTPALATFDGTDDTAGDDSSFGVARVVQGMQANSLPNPIIRAGSELPPAKRPRTSGVSRGDLPRSASDVGLLRSTNSSATRLLNGNYEIRAPSPPVGVDILEASDFISEKMAKLAQSLSSRYRPENKRDVEPLERGYWLLDCSNWSPETWMHAWAFLTAYVEKSSAGWGTWCRRDESGRWLRLFCWGHAMQHMYLLLYLASERELKKMGATWIGADGEPAVYVPPVEK